MLLINLIKKFKELHFRTFNKPPKSLEAELIANLDQNKFAGELLLIQNDIKNVYFLNCENLKSIEGRRLISILDEAEQLISIRVNNLSKISKQLIDDLNSNFEENSYIVGGFCRDAIAGFESKDVDFCTSIDYDTLAETLKELGWNVKTSGKQFLVLNVSKNDERFEIANLRSDKNNKKGVIGTINEDAARRDFSVGAVYFDIRSNMVIDPNGNGIIDCFDRKLRFIGNPKERLNEDFVRGWRFFRFIERGWNPDKKSLKAVRENWDKIYEASNPTRVRIELEKMVGL